MSENKMPEHIGFIMDGNRRWAKANSLPSFEGHRRGYEKMKEIGKWCLKKGINNVTVFAFSTENWRRSKEEVDYLMKLFYQALTSGLAEFKKMGFRLKIIGRREGLPHNLRTAIIAAEGATADNSRGIFNIALNYGGRAEIVDAAKALVESGIEPRLIDESVFKKFLYAPEANDPDLIVRTSGEQRLSGFLLWYSSYSELYFTATYWPAFGEAELETILNWYQERRRRFGK